MRVWLSKALVCLALILASLSNEIAHAQPSSDAVAIEGLSVNTAFAIPGDLSAPRAVSYKRSGGACAASRCYGRALIGWTPQVAACARGVRVGVITTGIDNKHPAFVGMSFSHDTFTPPQAIAAPHWRGTALLALLAGNPLGGVSGLVPEGRFIVADTFFADKRGKPVGDLVALLKALNWMNTQRVEVVLVDVAGPRDQLVDDAISQLTRQGSVVVMPAADQQSTEPHKDVITVRAVNKALKTSATITGRVDLAAPGVDIWTALPNKKYGYASGNSFAAAHAVAALAAVYRSVPETVSPQERRQRLLALLPVKDLGQGYGRGLALAAKDCVPGLLPVSPSLMRMPTVDDRSRTPTSNAK